MQTKPLDLNSSWNVSPFFYRWVTAVLRHRLFVVLLVTGITVLAVVEAVRKLRIETSIEVFDDRDSSSAHVLEQFRDAFGRDDYFLVLVEGDVFSMPYVQRLKKLHEELASINLKLSSLGERKSDRDRARHRGERSVTVQKKSHERDWDDESGGSIVDEITSLINFRRVRSNEAGIAVGKMMDPLPSQSELLSIKAEVLANPTMVGQLVSVNARYSVIALRTQFMNDEDSNRVHDKIQEIMKKHEAPDFKLLISGLPALNNALNVMTGLDAGRMMAMSFLFLFLVMVFLFRRPAGFLAPILVIILTFIWMMGLMAFLGWPITMLTNILPAYLICATVGDQLNLQAVYGDNYNRGISSYDAIVNAFSTSGVPCLFTTLSTMAGLASFRFSNITGIREMGMTGALGTGISWVLTMLLLPVMLSVTKSGVGWKPVPGGDFIERFVELCRRGAGIRRGDSPRRRYVTLAIGSLLGVVGLLGITKLYIAHNPLTWIPANTPIRAAFETMDEQLGGTVDIQLLIQAKTERGMKDLELLRGLEKLEQHVRKYKDQPSGKPLVGSVISLLDVVRETNKALHSGDPAYYRLPDTDRELADILFLFENAGPSQFRKLCTTDLQITQLTMRIRWLEATHYLRFAEYIQAGIDQFIGYRADVKPTGGVYTLLTTLSSIIYNLISSFTVAALTILVMMSILLRSVLMGLLSMVPNIVPILMLMGSMGLGGMPIDMANLMIASMVIGFTMDNTIHLWHHFRMHYKTNGDAQEAVDFASTHTGRALVGSSIILCLGFAVYLFAKMAGLRSFGILMPPFVILALVGDLMLGTAVLKSVYRKRRTSPAVIQSALEPPAA